MVKLVDILTTSFLTPSRLFLLIWTAVKSQGVEIRVLNWASQVSSTCSMLREVQIEHHKELAWQNRKKKNTYCTSTDSPIWCLSSSAVQSGIPISTPLLQQTCPQSQNHSDNQVPRSLTRTWALRPSSQTQPDVVRLAYRRCLLPRASGRQLDCLVWKDWGTYTYKPDS